MELEAFSQLAIGDVAKNLIDIFFINEELKKYNGVENNDLKAPKEIKNVGLLGAGVMGGGIAWLFAKNNINVRIKDITQNAIAIGFNQVLKIFNQLKKIKKATNEEINIKIDNITSSLNYSGFEKIDFVVEAIVENMAIKKSTLAELETKVANDTLIVSNTSSLSISEMSQSLQNKERFAGMHFFNPVNKMPLVEVIKGHETSDATVITIVELAKKLGKTPIVVKDVPGFLVNRILLPFMNEAAYLLEEGTSLNRIDSLMENFGMPMGPFFLADVVGIDVGCKVAHLLEEGYGERMKVANLLNEIQSQHKNLLGQKSKQGFYLYDDKNQKTQINPQMLEIVSNLYKAKAITKDIISNEEIVDRCILTMVNEAAKCLEEEVVKNAKYLDMAMIMGAGFPAFRGGLLKYCDHRGIDKVVAKLKEFESKIGRRFEVSQLLLEMAQNKERFYLN